jgi:hypothetical protein
MKVEAISRIVPPSSKRLFRGFLGMSNYLRQHIPRYSHHSAALTDLLKGGRTLKFQWTERQQVCFEAIKALLARSVQKEDREKITQDQFLLYLLGVGVGESAWSRDDNTSASRIIPRSDRRGHHYHHHPYYCQRISSPCPPRPPRRRWILNGGVPIHCQSNFTCARIHGRPGRH